MFFECLGAPKQQVNEGDTREVGNVVKKKKKKLNLDASLATFVLSVTQLVEAEPVGKTSKLASDRTAVQNIMRLWLRLNHLLFPV